MRSVRYLLIWMVVIMPWPAAALDLPSPVGLDSLAVRELYRTVIALDGSHDAKVAEWAGRHADQLHVGFLFDLSRRMLGRDPDKALEWYAVASMRGSYDIAACRDRTVAQMIANLTQNGADVLAYARTHPAAYADAAMRALARNDVFSVRGSLCLPMESSIDPDVAQLVRDEFGSQFDPMAPSPAIGRRH